MEAVVGATGATLVHPGGAKLIVPPGALAADTTLSLTGSDPPAPSALGGATALGQRYEAGPDGQSFQKPVELLIPFDPTRLPAGASTRGIQAMMAPRGATSFAALTSEVDMVARVVQTRTVHFTDFVPVLNPNPVFITSPEVLPNGTVGAAYAQSFTATGGTGAHSWALGDGSALPPGLALSAGGDLTGSPELPSLFAFFVRASDGAGRSVQRPYELTVVPAVHPAPVLTSLSPASADQGSPALTVTLIGSQFVPSSVAQWDGAAVATTFVSGTQLAAGIPAANLTASGTHQIRVVTPTPGGGTSAEVAFTVAAVAQNPVPAIATISPTFLPVTHTDSQITVTGSSFLPTSSVAIGAQGISTSFVSATQLLATIPASFLSAPGTLAIGVFNPAPGGGFSPRTVNLTVGNPNPVPTLGSMSPTSAAAGSAGLTLSMTGSGFVSGAQIFWDATSLATTVASATSASATVPAALLANPGSRAVRIVNPSPGGGASGELTFTVSPVATHPAPTLEGLDPLLVGLGAGDTAVVITGTNFIPTSAAKANGQAIPTSYVSPTRLETTVPASFFATAGYLPITVENPAPGGGTSNFVNIAVIVPYLAPTLTSIAPASTNAGSGSFTLTATGSNFLSGSPLLYWNNTWLGTNVLSDTTAQVTVPASLVATAGTATITMFTAGPGGGTSAPLTFTIGPAGQPTGVTCTSTQTHADCSRTVTVENNVQFARVPFNGDPIGAMSVDSSGVRFFYHSTSQLTTTNASHTLYLGYDTPPSRNGRASIGSGTLTFDMDAGRGFVPNCPTPLIRVSCTGSTAFQ